MTAESFARLPQVLFLGSQYAGHATRFANLRSHALQAHSLRCEFRTVTGWRPDGRLERLPLVPAGLKGRLRAVSEASAVARMVRPDAIWTSCREELAPFAWAQWGRLNRPMVLDLDATDAQLESMAMAYFGRAPKRGLRRKISSAIETLVYQQATVFTPWSNWAAEGLREAGVDSNKIQVIPPGVDLSQWRPVHRDSADRPLRILFVGGDFERKGGDLLLRVIQASEFDVEVTIVTRDEFGLIPPNVRLVSAGPNSDELRNVYAWADIFVMPTRADCFGIATIEAMAAGLPVIVGDVGGASDIVEHGVTGWLIEPGEAALAPALMMAHENRHLLPLYGTRGRQRVEERFDARRNDEKVLELLLSLL